MRYAVAALIMHAAIKMLLKNVTTTLGRGLFVVVFLALLLTPAHPLLMIVMGGSAGLALNYFKALPGQAQESR